MIYCYCTQCGLKFRKGHYKNPPCLRCGAKEVREENIPISEVTEAMRAADRIFRESLKKGK